MSLDQLLLRYISLVDRRTPRYVKFQTSGIKKILFLLCRHVTKRYVEDPFLLAENEITVSNTGTRASELQLKLQFALGSVDGGFVYAVKERDKSLFVAFLIPVGGLRVTVVVKVKYKVIHFFSLKALLLLLGLNNGFAILLCRAGYTISR